MSPDTGVVARLLNCFSYPSRDIHLACQNEIPLQSAAWNVDIEWYALILPP